MHMEYQPPPSPEPHRKPCVLQAGSALQGEMQELSTVAPIPWGLSWGSPRPISPSALMLVATWSLLCIALWCGLMPFTDGTKRCLLSKLFSPHANICLCVVVIVLLFFFKKKINTLLSAGFLMRNNLYLGVDFSRLSVDWQCWGWLSAVTVRAWGSQVQGMMHRVRT